MAKFLYKLTDEFGFTENQTYWGEGVKHEIAKELRDNTKPLCTKHYLHAYENPLVAVFMNSAYRNHTNPILWQATGWVQRRDGQLKCGCFSLRTIQKIQLPKITTNQKVRAAIYCALTQQQSERFKNWAAEWLNGENRITTYYAAYAYDTVAAAHAAAAAAANTYATHAAAHTAYVAANTYDTVAAAYVAANAFAAAAAAAANASLKSFNLIEILNCSIKEEVVS